MTHRQAPHRVPILLDSAWTGSSNKEIPGKNKSVHGDRPGLFNSRGEDVADCVETLVLRVASMSVVATKEEGTCARREFLPSGIGREACSTAQGGRGPEVLCNKAQPRPLFGARAVNIYQSPAMTLTNNTASHEVQLFYIPAGLPGHVVLVVEEHEGLLVHPQPRAP